VAATEVAGGRIVHAYGHGGAGMTLSWGCADEVVQLCVGKPREIVVPREQSVRSDGFYHS
jgi:glycine/D-amino acid oxidase-like deaminating enzyme